MRVEGSSETLRAAEDELKRGLTGLLARPLPPAGDALRDGLVIAGTKASSPLVASLDLTADLGRAGAAGFVLRAMSVRGHRALVIAANSDVGVLYGAFALLRADRDAASASTPWRSCRRRACATGCWTTGTT